MGQTKHLHRSVEMVFELRWNIRWVPLKYVFSGCKKNSWLKIIIFIMMVHYHTVMVWFWFSRNFDAMMLLPYSHCLVVANGTCLVVAIVSNDVLQLVQLTYDVSSYYSNDIVSIIISYPIYIYINTLLYIYIIHVNLCMYPIRYSVFV